MSSNINPNNINGNFPVAGQDNDSQGFRDNFTNILNNFSFAATEINALQSTTASVQTVVQSNGNVEAYYGNIAQGLTVNATTHLIGAATLDANLTVAGISAFTGNISVGGVASITGNLTSANLTVGNVRSTGNLSLTNNMSVGGNLIVSNVAVTNNVAVTGNIILTSNLIVTTGTVVGNLTVTEAVTTPNLIISGSTIASGGAVQYNTPSANFTYSMNSGISFFILNPTTSITNGQITLPTGNIQGAIISVHTTQAITNLQVLGNPGTVLVPSANISLGAGNGSRYYYQQSEGKWFKIN
jgi:hypothetical protein